MTKIQLILLATVWISVSNLFAQPERKPDAKILEHLKKFRSDQTKSMVDGTPEKIQTYYSDNIRLMPEFQKTVTGKSNVVLYHRAFIARFHVMEYSKVETEILDLGEVIAETGMFTLKVKLRSTQKEYELNGKYQNFWRSNNGRLMLITEAWNYNHALEIEEQMRFSDIPETDVALKPHLAVNTAITFQLAALNRLMEAAVTQHDAKIWSQFYAEDGMFLYSRHPVYAGRKALNGFFENHVNELPVFEKLDIRNDEVIDLGRYVIEYASHIAIWRNGEYSGVGLGKDVRIWRRENDCSLKIFRHMGMYD